MMERCVVRRSGQRPLAFYGEQIFSGSTSPDDTKPDFSGIPGEWTQIEIYRTDKGNFVLGVGSFSAYPVYREKFRAEVFDTLEEVVDYLEEKLPYWAEKVSLRFEIVEEL